MPVTVHDLFCTRLLPVHVSVPGLIVYADAGVTLIVSCELAGPLVFVSVNACDAVSPGTSVPKTGPGGVQASTGTCGAAAATPAPVPSTKATAPAATTARRTLRIMKPPTRLPGRTPSPAGDEPRAAPGSG